jgi:hypothetical protein
MKPVSAENVPAQSQIDNNVPAYEASVCRECPCVKPISPVNCPEQKQFMQRMPLYESNICRERSCKKSQYLRRMFLYKANICRACPRPAVWCSLQQLHRGALAEHHAAARPPLGSQQVLYKN